MNTVCLQGEMAECGLACVSSIAELHNKNAPLSYLRTLCRPSDLGTSLYDLTELFGKLDLNARAVLFNIQLIQELPTPCILHLNDSHYVVLEKVNSYCAVVMNPALGRQVLKLGILKMSLSGYAIVLDEEKKLNANNSFFNIFQFKNKVIKLDALLLIYGLLSTLLSLILPAIMLNINNGFKNFENLDFHMLFYLAIAQIISVVIIRQGYKRTMIIEGATMAKESNKMYARFLNNKMSFFERRTSTDVANRALKFVGAQVAKSTIYNTLIICIIQLIISFLIVGYISPYLAFFLLSVSCISSFLAWVSRKNLSQISIVEESYRENIFKHFVESFNSISDIKSKKASKNLCVVNDSKVNQLVDFNIESGLKHLKFPIMQEIIGIFDMILTLCLCFWLIQYNNTPLSSVFLFFYVKQVFSTSFNRLIEINDSFGAFDAAQERGKDVIEFEKDNSIHQFDNDRVGGLHHVGIVEKKSDRNSIIFPELIITKGQLVAVTGCSGSGKTTLLKILSGLYCNIKLLNDDGGEMDNNVIISSNYYHATNQDFISGSVRENITMFDANHCDSDILTLIEKLGLGQVIASLPQGIDTKINDYTNPFSSGEKQRVLLCRALLSNKNTLLLDEPMSNLDELSCDLIMSTLKGTGKTIVFTSHNPSSIRKADKIIDLNIKNQDHESEFS
ncbi:cysteine peptidase family C39 domain-containing protein [Vibrio sp. L5-1]|jgi:ABC-type bacteriocin/lantibiotic exporter with double-glycine peptidase domain|uniref:Cysteine peptidase family C39 domain-containing protein n=3 Tax=Vibrio TaxID=662 RepID=A0A9X3CLM7_9VIBR|nr:MULTISPECIES: cysteine peptidase family C39 domain-containing protein [Vibrio]MCF7497058.1 cysteine peptidase family C39 domain-containing protein [Vibrio sp. L5-1]MCW8345496.1 cysteine peptidase family C39 domain-containing protein [Vibrio qingdaonensis]